MRFWVWNLDYWLLGIRNFWLLILDSWFSMLHESCCLTHDSLGVRGWVWGWAVVGGRAPPLDALYLPPRPDPTPLPHPLMIDAWWLMDNYRRLINNSNNNNNSTLILPKHSPLGPTSIASVNLFSSKRPSFSLKMRKPLKLTFWGTVRNQNDSFSVKSTPEA